MEKFASFQKRENDLYFIITGCRDTKYYTIDIKNPDKEVVERLVSDMTGIEESRKWIANYVYTNYEKLPIKHKGDKTEITIRYVKPGRKNDEWNQVNLAFYLRISSKSKGDFNMDKEEWSQKILENNYIDVAFKRYLTFKDSPYYGEQYKYEILSDLNETLHIEDVTSESVQEIAIKLKKANPNTDTFANWRYFDYFIQFIEAKPQEAAELWNQLLDSNITLANRIEKFREEGKRYDQNIALGAPLFGYILAAFDSKKYPLYKEEIFKKAKRTYGIESPLGTVGNNYEEFRLLCDIMLGHLKKDYEWVTILDVQDFLFCSTTYDKIIVESAVEYLYGMAIELNEFKQSPKLLLNYINNLDKEKLKELQDIYRKSKKVNKIKFTLVDQLLEDNPVSMAEFEEIKAKIKKENDKDILRSWTNFTIMFQLYYHHKKDKVEQELGKIHKAIRNFEELSEMEFHIDKILNGFSWNQHFGGSRSWLAVYEKKYPSHKNAPQLTIGISEEGVDYGLFYGSDHTEHGKKDIENIKEIDTFSYEKLHEKIAAVSNQLVEDDNDEPINTVYEREDSFTVEQWNKMIQSNNIFRENDLEYLFAMHEFGGEASAAQLAEKLGKHFSSFNSPVVNLAKRIEKETGIEIPKINMEKNYWYLLFNGEHKSNRFIWKLKDNLKEAIEQNYEKYQETAEIIETYAKEDFLNEVFMEEEQYNHLVNLLQYKKNIILQGPPGVGKTFVSKRLAFSLMGVQDESRVEVVQFHQTYAYEDFVMGFRPDENGGFHLKTGIFYNFCERAIEEPNKDFYFVIDEINRGNLSKIFGELFMLIESDKRGEYVTMGYSGNVFTVPGNVYIIGTMNTADRSLAQMEIALRRRFGFITLAPAFNQKWQDFMLEKGISLEMVERVLNMTEKINSKIRDDFQLGSNYEIGHSFFTTTLGDMDESTWYETIVQYEIKPLLEEYFFDRPEEVKEMLEDIK